MRITKVHQTIRDSVLEQLLYNIYSELKMSQEIVNYDVNNAISLEYSCNVKDEFDPDNKVCVSESTILDTINISNTELSEYIKNDKIKKYEMSSVAFVKTDLQSSEVSEPGSNNVKIEDRISPVEIQIKFDNELLFCNHCHEVYQDYCTKCKVLVHILNRIPSHNTCDKAREVPKYMLETRESIGYLGIFSLKAIPEDVRFGPFTGLNCTGVSLRIKRGRFVVSDDKLENLNWMRYINPARNICEQNLIPFQYDSKLYYHSTRRIEEGEELLVYFGEEYEDNLLQNVEMDFVPTAKKDVENVFACIACCLGFSSKEYLAEHKAEIHGETKEILSVEELVQCPSCKIYLEAKEYSEHHMNYCCETNDGHCVSPAPEADEIKIERRSCLRRNAKDLEQKNNYKCLECEYKTNIKSNLRRHINSKHLEQNYYKCAECEYKTNIKSNLQRHIQRKHLEQNDYKCAECEYKTNIKSNLQRHIKGRHLEQDDYKCAECEFKTNCKFDLQRHIKRKHLEQNDYKCAECEYKTNFKSKLQIHIKSKHLEQNDYKCAECEYKTNIKANLKLHIKRQHL